MINFLKKLMFLMLLLFGVSTSNVIANSSEYTVSKIPKSTSMTHSVTIPQTINLTQDVTTFSVQVKGNLPSVSTLQVSPISSSVIMRKDGDTTYSKQALISFPNKIWTGKELTNVEQIVDGTISFQENKAGRYSGTTSFNIVATEKYKITYILNGGTFATDINVPKVYEVAHGITTLPTPTRTGARFLGWHDGNKMVTSIPQGATGDITLVAKWEKQAFAVYSADDQSLNFYKREQIPSIGEQFEGKTVTNVFTGIEETANNFIPWNSVKSNIKKVEIVDVVSPSDMGNWFRDCSNCKEFINLGKIDTSNVHNMSSLFNGCISTISLDVSKWNTSKVTNMGHMIHNCPKLETIIFGSIDTSSVQYMDNFLKGATNLQNVDMSGLNIRNVRDISGMFNGCTSLQTIRTPSVINNPTRNNMTSKTFYDESDNYKEYVVGTFPTNITSSHTLVANPPQKKAFAVYSDTDKSLNFYKRYAVPNVGEQFEGKTVTNIYTNVENTGNYPSWFDIGSNILKVDVVDNEIQPKNCFRWFYNFRNAKTMNLAKLDTSKTTNMYYMFSDCLSLTSLNISSFNTSNVTNMNYMFSGCSTLTSIDINNWDVRNVSSMSGIFVNCSALQSVDLSRWNTSNVTQMNSLFANCNSLKEVNLTGWNTNKVTNMDFMFDTCSSIQSIDLSSFDATNVTDMSRMFKGCTNLKTIKTPKNIKNPILTDVTSKTFYDETDNNKKYVAGTFLTNTTTSHTLVDEIRYMITYDVMGGTMPSNYPTTYISSEGLNSLPIPTKPNRKFVGWSNVAPIILNIEAQEYEFGEPSGQYIYEESNSFLYRSTRGLDVTISFTMPYNGTVSFTKLVDGRWGYEDDFFNGNNITYDTNISGYFAKGELIVVKLSGRANYSDSMRSIKDLKIIPDIPVNEVVSTNIPVGTIGDKMFYAKWERLMLTGNISISNINSTLVSNISGVPSDAILEYHWHSTYENTLTLCSDEAMYPSSPKSYLVTTKGPSILVIKPRGYFWNDSPVIITITDVNTQKEVERFEMYKGDSYGVEIPIYKSGDYSINVNNTYPNESVYMSLIVKDYPDSSVVRDTSGRYDYPSINNVYWCEVIDLSGKYAGSIQTGLYTYTGY